MFHMTTPRRRATTAHLSRMMEMADLSQAEDEEVLQKQASKSHRAAIKPFARDEQFADTRASICLLSALILSYLVQF